MNLFTPPKKIKGNLAGLDGNSFVLLGYFSEQAKKQGWNDSEIKLVLDEATSGDYAKLTTVLMSHLKN